VNFQKISKHSIGDGIEISVPYDATHFAMKAGDLVFYKNEKMRKQEHFGQKRTFIPIPDGTATVKVEHSLKESNHVHTLVGFKSMIQRAC